MFLLALLPQSGCLLVLDFAEQEVVASAAQVLEVSVEPTFSTAEKWNQYVENNAVTPYGGTGLACDGDGTIDGGARAGETANWNACLNGGELRKVVLSHLSSCQGLELIESLDAFEWTCAVESGKPTFFTTRLRATKNLSDLLNSTGTGWEPNSVEIKKSGTRVAYSADAVWWPTTPVVAIDALTAATPGATNIAGITAVDNGSSGNVDAYRIDTAAVYTVNSNLDTVGLNINVDGAAFIVRPGFTLRFVSSGNNNCADPTLEPGNTRACLLAAGTQNYLWIEGNYNANSAAHYPIGLDVGVFHQVRNTYTQKALYSGINTAAVQFSQFRRNYARLNTSKGIYLSNSDFNRVIDFRADNNTSDGVMLTAGSDGNILQRLHLSNNTQGGITVSASNNNTFTEMLIASNDQAGYLQGSSSGNISSHFTFYANSTAGWAAQSAGANNVVAQGVILNTANRGIFLHVVDNTHLANIVSVGNGGRGMQTQSTADQTIVTRNFIISGNAGNQCDIGASTGTSVSTDAVQVCGGDNPTYALDVHNPVDLSTSFLGLVTDDSENGTTSLSTGTSGIPGVVALASVLDWRNFQSFFRFWGEGDNTTLLHSTNRGRCDSGNCAAWDLALASASPLFATSGAFSSANGAYTSGQNCPSAAHGDFTLAELRGAEISGDSIGDDDGNCEFGEACANSKAFLINALEVLDDGVGNEDGLCNTGEQCWYSPHFGVFQGETPTVLPNSSCTFEDGTGALPVTGVTLFAR